jgi:AmpD protein
MKIFELILLALGLYYFFIYRPKAIKIKQYHEQLRKQQENAQQQAAAAATAANAAVIQKMVACSFCKVRLPVGDAIETQQRFYCCVEHQKALDTDGLVGNCHWALSENYDERPVGLPIDTVVLHYISLPEGRFGGRAVEEFFCNRLNPAEDPYFETIADLRVSAHFFIKRTGELVQFVPTTKRAWHAGKSNLMGRENCNDFSIGIELEGTGEVPFEKIQYQTLKDLIKEIQTKHPIEKIVGHSDIAPDRKQDPGRFFDWQYFQQISKIPDQKFPYGLQSR